MKNRLPFLLAALFLCHGVAIAATLQAKVVDVTSGNTLIVSNINRSVKVRLKGIEPPEVGQPFSDAARDHLKALVLNKVVVVDYTNFATDYLNAKVALEGVDIASQMLRDGAAWYDPSLEYTLSQSDRELYARCEQLARDEKRGLWQDVMAVAPWEFRKAQQTAKIKPEANFNAVRSAMTSRAANRGKSLSNTDLMGGLIGPGSLAGNPNIKQLWPDSPPDEWHAFHSQAPRFSISVPGNSFLFEYPVLDGQKKIVNINYLLGSSDNAVYTLMWASGSNDNATDVTAADSTIQGFLSGMNSYFQSKAMNVRAIASPGRFVKVGSYSGKEYTLTAGGVLSGIARVVSRQTGDQRELIALAVLGPGSDSVVSDFLNSIRLAGR